MQSASLSARVLGTPGQIWSGARTSMRGGVEWSALLVFLLTLSIARSTATAAWVPGMDAVPLIALSGALLMAVVAVLPVRWPIGLGFGMLLGPIAAGLAAWPTVHAMHPTDYGLDVWWTRLTDRSGPREAAGGCAVGFLGERGGRDGGAERDRDHASAPFHNRPHARCRVQRVFELGAAPAKTQPSRHHRERVRRIGINRICR